MRERRGRRAKSTSLTALTLECQQPFRLQFRPSCGKLTTFSQCERRNDSNGKGRSRSLNDKSIQLSSRRESEMSTPMQAQLHRGCCFIVPPEILKELSRNQRLTPQSAKMYQDSYLETMRLRTVREGHRIASLIGQTSAILEAAPHQAEQHIFDCRNRTSLPGRAVANPSAGAVGFQTVFNTTGQVADFYRTVLGRNSVDNRGMDLVSSLNYGRNYQNAFWNGQQMVYGNGDQHIFIDFWKSPDVIGHELTHGVTQNESGLRYEGESGALNESISDCFGAVFNQWVMQAPASR